MLELILIGCANTFPLPLREGVGGGGIDGVEQPVHRYFRHRFTSPTISKKPFTGVRDLLLAIDA